MRVCYLQSCGGGGCQSALYKSRQTFRIERSYGGKALQMRIKTELIEGFFKLQAADIHPLAKKGGG